MKKNLRRSLIPPLALAVPTLLLAATLGGPVGVPLPLFPHDNWWNVDVSSAPLDPGSAAYISFIGAGRNLHPDFGGQVYPGSVGIYGLPYVVVEGNPPKKPVSFTYWSESDGGFAPGEPPVSFYPIPDEAITQPHWIEGGAPGNQNSGGDRHMLIVDRTRNHLYELYALRWEDGQWHGGSGAFFDMNTNDRRPEGWTSADAAGLAILPGLVRYDEACGSEEIRHAFRFTVRTTNGYVWPASHRAGNTSGALPMGARLRLKAGVDISAARFPDPCVRRVFRAMKTYGLIVADNGSDMFVTGTFDSRWPDRFDAGFHAQFKTLEARDFQVIELGWKPAAPPPSLSVVTPNGAESWPVGSHQTIRWSSRGLGSSHSIRVSLITGVTTVLTTVPHDRTSFAWTVPGPTASNARIRVECVGCAGPVLDESDAPFSITPAVTPPPVRGDFNSDGRPDIVWQNARTGALSVWYMDGTQRTQAEALQPGRVSRRWRLAATADLNADDKPDLLWQRDDGRIVVWYMDGARRVAAGPLGPGSVGRRWRMAATADVNDDGQPDILWQNEKTGALSVWYMSGAGLVSQGSLDPGKVGRKWRLAAAADLNSDGRPDILWQNEKTGALSVWFMSGAAPTPPAAGHTGPVALSWTLAAAADFSSDGQPDLFWQRDSGRLAAWYMHGTRRDQAVGVTPPRVSAGWIVAGPR